MTKNGMDRAKNFMSDNRKKDCYNHNEPKSEN